MISTFMQVQTAKRIASIAIQLKSAFRRHIWLDSRKNLISVTNDPTTYEARLEKNGLALNGLIHHVFKMKFAELFKVPLRAVLLVSLAIQPRMADADTKERILVVRERATASLLNGTFTFKVLKLKGYSIDIKVFGKRRSLKIGETISPENAECLVTFQEIATETRIARFTSNCL